MLLVLIAALALASSAYAAAPELTEAMDGFTDAAEREITALEGMPAKSAMKARKMLQKAADAAKAFDGTIDKASLKMVAKALGFAAKAKHDSQDVADALAAVRDALEARVNASFLDLLIAKDGLSWAKFLSRVDRDIAKGQKAVDKAAALWSVKYASSAKCYIKAILTYEKATLTAGKFAEKEAGTFGLPSGLRLDSLGRLINETGGVVWIEDLVFKLEVSGLGLDQTVKASASDTTLPGTFPLPMDTEPFDATDYDTILGTFSKLPVKIEGSITYETSVGKFSLKWDID
jgi:hypothetical protein